MKKLLHSVLLAVLGCVLWNIAAAQNSDKTYTVAVVPQYSSTQVYRDWTPLLAQLELTTGYHFQLRVYHDFYRFETEFEKGIPDFVFLNPYHMTVARHKQQYRPLIRDTETISGILVVPKDSPIKILADLNGKTVAFPSPNALGASLYIRALLAEKFHIKINPVYVNGHQNVYRHVILGEAAAGGGVSRTLEKEAETIKSQLSVIFNTPAIASHPLAAHPRVPAAVGQKIVDALLAMSHDAEGGKLLAAVQLSHPVTADYKRDYSGLAKLKLERYAVTQTPQTP
jgi:phosphonate transport system substrate-binding protein